MYRSLYKRERPSAECNMTPLIDVTFLLIIFFILAGTFASMDKAALNVPVLASTRRLDDRAAPYKAVVQVLPMEADDGASTRAAQWRIGAIRMAAGDLPRLTEALTRARAAFEKRKADEAALASANFEVEVRADRSVMFADVRPVLAGVAAAGFQRVHYVAVGSKEP